MRFKFLLPALMTVAACSGLPFAGMFGGKANTQQTSTSSSKTEETHTINGHPVDRNGNREDSEPLHSKQEPVAQNAGKKLGATCSHNDECASEVCFTGYGSLGYCSKMCDSFAQCPSFWECKNVGNAPQKICQQEKD